MDPFLLNVITNFFGIESLLGDCFFILFQCELWFVHILHKSVYFAFSTCFEQLCIYLIIWRIKSFYSQEKCVCLEKNCITVFCSSRE